MPYYYGNYGGGNRGFLGGAPPVTRNLIIINIIVFIATLINREFMTTEFAVFYPTSPFFHWWQVLTHMFMHGGFWHILFNMYTLWLFGSVVENIIGSKKFVLFYFLTGTLSGIASFFAYLFTGTNAILLGASGALYAVMLLFSVIYPRAVIYLFGIMPIRAPVLVIIYFFMELFSQMGQYGGSVAHMTHLSGLVFAFLYCLIRLRIKPWRAWGL